MLSLSETQLKEIVQEVVQEAVEKLTYELAPQIVVQALERKISALRQRQAGKE